VPLRNHLAGVNYNCFSEKLKSCVTESYQAWESGGKPHYGLKLPPYEEISDSLELQGYAKCSIRYKSILCLAGEKGLLIKVEHEGLQTFVSRLLGASINVKAVAQLAAGTLGIPHASPFSVLQNVLSKEGAGFVLRSNTSVTFQANNTLPINCNSMGSVMDSVTCSSIVEY
jgi:hypothetical protein